MRPVDSAVAKPPPPPPPAVEKADKPDTAQAAAPGKQSAVDKKLKADGFEDKGVQPAQIENQQAALEAQQAQQAQLAAKAAADAKAAQEAQAAALAAQQAQAAQQAAAAATQAAATAADQAKEVKTDLNAATGAAADAAKQAATAAQAAATQASQAAETAKAVAESTGNPAAIAVAQQAEQAAATAQAAATQANESAAQVEKTQQAVQDIQNRGQGLDLAIVNQALQSTGDPKVKEDLVSLVTDGKLTEASKGAGNILDILVDLAGGGDTATGADKQDVMKNLVSDLARPERMVQGQGNKDCGGATAAYVLASESPAEYTRIVSDLATTGTAELTTNSANPPTLTVDQVQGGNGRPVTQELIQSSFVNYSDQKVSVNDAVKDVAEKGLFASELEKGASDMLGKDYDSMYIPDAGEAALDSTMRDYAKGEASRVLNEQVSSGAKAMVNYDGHWVVVDDIQGGKATVFNSSGERQKIDLNQLIDKADSIVYRSDVSKTSGVLHNQVWADAGGGGKIGDGMNDGDDYYGGYP